MALTFYATNTFTGNGSTKVYNINFASGYIDASNVKARYQNTVSGEWIDMSIASVAGNVVTLNQAPPNGRVFQIYRDTNKSAPVVDFADGAILNETNLDAMALQAVMVAAEAYDNSNNLIADINSLRVVSSNAYSKAVSAEAIANGAVSTANTASGTASLAKNTADLALSTANSALSTANTANSNANTALSGVNNLTPRVTAAEGTLVTTTNTANNALVTANAAQSNALNATAIANGKAAKGANSDITSLSGLTTALSISQGGTGATTAPAARQAIGIPDGGTVGYVLTWDGTAWVPQASSGGGGGVTYPITIDKGGTGETTAAAALAALGVPAGTTVGEVLTWDGSKWVAQAGGGGGSPHGFAYFNNTSGANWTVPAGVTSISIWAIGGGGGGSAGGGAPAGATFGGTGGLHGVNGYVSTKLNHPVTPGQLVLCIPGAGGNGAPAGPAGSASTQSSTAGGNSTVSIGGVNILTAQGGLVNNNTMNGKVGGTSITAGARGTPRIGTDPAVNAQGTNGSIAPYVPVPYYLAAVTNQQNNPGGSGGDAGAGGTSGFKSNYPGRGGDGGGGGGAGTTATLGGSGGTGADGAILIIW